MDNPENIIGDIVRLGCIATVDAKACRCTVVIGDMTTGPLSWFASRAGGTRTWSAPTVGEQCLLICPEGDTAAGIVLAGLYCDAFPAPDTDPNTDATVYADGTRIAYDSKAHALVATLPDGGTAAITAPGGITIKADGGIKITGDVEITGGLKASKDVTAAGISLKSHAHSAVKAGTDISGKPQ